MSKKQEDLNFGKNKEDEIFDVVKHHFNLPLLKKRSVYSIIDFSDNNNYLELKSRRCKYEDYDTSIIGHNKIIYADKLNKNVYFLFYFTDGLYYIKYNKKLFDQFEIKNEYIFRDGKKENKINCHIPINKLILIQ